MEQRLEALLPTVEGRGFEDFFALLRAASDSAHLVQMFDTTIVRAHVSAAGAKGGQIGQALDRSRGGFSTKIHLKCDHRGLPLAFLLTGGERNNAPFFKPLPDASLCPMPRAVVADKGHDSHANRQAARNRGVIPVIPQRKNAKNPQRHFPKALYRGRARITQLFGKIKRFKRIALRREKMAANFASIPALVCAFIWI